MDLRCIRSGTPLKEVYIVTLEGLLKGFENDVLLFCVHGGFVPEDGYIQSLSDAEFIEYSAYGLFDGVGLYA